MHRKCSIPPALPPIGMALIGSAPSGNWRDDDNRSKPLC
jgi:hypothetical protein